MQGIELACGRVPQSLRVVVYERDRGYCRYCYRFMKPEHRFHIDHVRPRSFGGPTVLINLVLACPPCNTAKRDQLWTPLPIFGEYTQLTDDMLKQIKVRRRAKLSENHSEIAWRRAARMLEGWILADEAGYGPGWVLPGADRLARELGCGLRSVREACTQLAAMGLITIRHGYGCTVRTERKRDVIEVPAGTVVSSRMPTFAEQDQWGIEPGVPMLVAGKQAWPGDRYEVRVGQTEG